MVSEAPIVGVKVCTNCKEELPRTSFDPRKGRGIYSLKSWCKSCSVSHNKLWRQTFGRETYLNKRRELRAKKTKSKYQLLIAYLQIHPCIDCNEKDILVLEFDHLNSDSKLADVSQMINNGVSWTRVEQEIEKCVVRCRNCHQRKTAKERNSWKYRLLVEGKENAGN